MKSKCAMQKKKSTTALNKLKKSESICGYFN